jgi:exopolysaccharide production protein ExoZ
VSEHALPSGERLDALQALRALAAGLVVFCHALGAWSVQTGRRAPDEDLALLGGLGVKVFFVISGFIITMSVTRMAVSRGGQASSVFMRRRLIRIVPLYWLATLAEAIRAAHAGAAPAVGDVVRSMLFIPFRNSPVLVQGWSLNYEMFFYIVFAVALLWGVRTRYWMVFATLLGLVFLRQVGLLTVDVLDPLYRVADPLLVYFLAGVVLALLRDRLRSMIDVTLPLFGVVTAFTGIAVAYAVAVHAGLNHPEAIWVELPLCVLSVAVCVVPRIPEPTHPRARAVLVRAGDGSYSTYLTHGLLLGAGAHILAAAHLAGNDVVFSLGEVAGCTLAGVAIYLAVEKPLIGRLNARLGRHRPQRHHAPEPAAVSV